jgi:methionine-gamma-lyase
MFYIETPAKLLCGTAFQHLFMPPDLLLKLAVSLGGTESLAEHPATMTHADVDPAERMVMGIGEQMVRLSIGVEPPETLIADMEQVLEAV